MLVNLVVIIGFVSKDPVPEFKYYPSGDIKSNFILETEGKKRAPDGTYEDILEYFHVTAWNSDVADLERLVTTGNQLLVTGRLRMIETKDPKYLVMRRNVIILADKIRLIAKTEK